jgi:protein-disulfide isomerase
MTLQQGQKRGLDMSKLQACVKAQNEDGVRASIKEAEDLGLNATPTVFINGQKIDGVVGVDTMREVLDAALRDAGQPVPARPAPASASK